MPDAHGGRLEQRVPRLSCDTSVGERRCGDTNDRGGLPACAPGQTDEWGDLELRTDSAHADTLRRLEPEEREAGLV